MFGSNRILSFVDKIPVFMHKVIENSFYYKAPILILPERKFLYKYLMFKVFQKLVCDIYPLPIN
jgi:hypothetical protein